MTPEQKFDGAVVAITGAGSGIGRALALRLAQCGAKLALTDIDADNLAATAALPLLQASPKVSTQVLDVADRAAFGAWADAVAAEFGEVNVIINNAGVSVSGSFDAVSREDFEWLMGINFWGVINGCESFLPHLRKARWGHVINIASLFGMMAVPNQCTYNAAKFAVRGFTESLTMELALDGSGIGVSCVCPGGIDTSIVKNARWADHAGQVAEAEKIKANFQKSLAATSPDSAAAQILAGAANGKQRIMVGKDAKILNIFLRLLPNSLAMKIIGKQMSKALL